MTDNQYPIEFTRAEVSSSTSTKIKSKFGQYLTPKVIADFMVSLINDPNENSTFLDAGAGIGSLTNSFIERMMQENKKQFSVVLFEVQPDLIAYLEQMIHYYDDQLQIHSKIYNEDFITSQKCIEADFAVINPPYFKIAAKSKHKLFIKENFDIDVPNIYAAFLVKTISSLAQDGELVAIIPRSFCNGVYFKQFREFLLQNTNIKHVHVFNSRNQAFKDDDVLQENIIIKLKKTKEVQQEIVVSHCDGLDFHNMNKQTYDRSEIILDSDANKFIRIPISEQINPLDTSSNLVGFENLEINVSTGPIVDFRTTHLLVKDDSGEIPLLYPQHFDNGSIKWPLKEFKKFNSINFDENIKSSFYEAGTYCLVKRFSTKEEPKRISTVVVQSDSFNSQDKIAFENHLNVFHYKKKGLDDDLARGLSAYLNSSFIDDYFRRFSGHTQVNVSDLKSLPYLPREKLISLGKFIKANNHQQIEQKIKELILGNND